MDSLKIKYNKIRQNNDFGGELPIIQKFIKGDGVGFFAFYKNIGDLQKRIRKFLF